MNEKCTLSPSMVQKLLFLGHIVDIINMKCASATLLLATKEYG